MSRLLIVSVALVAAVGCKKKPAVPERVDGIYERVCKMENDGARYTLTGASVRFSPNGMYASATDGHYDMEVTQGERSQSLRVSTGDMDTLPSSFDPNTIRIHLEGGDKAGPQDPLTVVVKLRADEAMYGPDKGKAVCYFYFDSATR